MIKDAYPNLKERLANELKKKDYEPEAWNAFEEKIIFLIERYLTRY